MISDLGTEAIQWREAWLEHPSLEKPCDSTPPSKQSADQPAYQN